MTRRKVLLVVHTGRSAAVEHAHSLATALTSADFDVRVLPGEGEDVGVAQTSTVAPEEAVHGVELVVALGGDGTFLRAAQLAGPADVPLLGVNLGRVGFLAEAESEHLREVAQRIVDADYDVDARLAAAVDVYDDGTLVGSDWVLNEVSVERAARRRMLDVLVSIDDKPVSRWGCDGVLAATPTGSTAYAFSAGGPVMWPNVEALLVVPISAHALFSRPLIVAPNSEITIEVQRDSPAMVTCDGRREHHVRTHGRIVVRRSGVSMKVVRLRQRSFTDRLVAKFGLNVDGWRASSDGSPK